MPNVTSCDIITYDSKYVFKNSNLFFCLWLADLANFDLKIGFYVKNSVYGQLEMTGNKGLIEKHQKQNFKTLFF